MVLGTIERLDTGGKLDSGVGGGIGTKLWAWSVITLPQISSSKLGSVRCLVVVHQNDMICNQVI